MNEVSEIKTCDQLWNAIVESKLAEHHLSLMNMNWWPTPPWEALLSYAQIARRVTGDCEAIRPLIENSNWRFNLYGVVIAVLADATSMVTSMVDQVGISWVSPQIAAGVAILGSGCSENAAATYSAALYRIATESAGGDDFKFSMAAYAAMRHWRSQQLSDFENSPDFLDKWRAGRKWYDLTQMHHERWRGVLPYLVSLK